MEIERKWQMEGFPHTAGLPCERCADVRQGYIATAPAVRIRESVPQGGAASYMLCFKGKGTLAREEIELPLDKELFTRLCVFTGQDLVTKRYRVYRLPGGEAFEVSLVDEGRPTAFYYAEVEFPTVEAAHAFVPPACLAPFLGEEQTENPAFSMSAYWKKTRVQPIADRRSEKNEG
ncbi:MAG: CYTH domain-containing protein [Ruthenibacterium sp.]